MTKTIFNSYFHVKNKLKMEIKAVQKSVMLDIKTRNCSIFDS